MRECVTLQFQRGGKLVGQLDAFDVHSGTVAGRKSWDGTVEGKAVDLPNLKAVAAFAKDNGLTFTKIYDAETIGEATAAELFRFAVKQLD